MPRPNRSLEPFARIPLNRFLGHELIASGVDSAHVQAPARPEFAQENGVVQGGILTALADTAAAYALMPSLGEGDTVAGIELSMSFVGAAHVGGAALDARARVIKRGRTLSVVEATVEQAERSVAHGRFTFLHYALDAP